MLVLIAAAYATSWLVGGKAVDFCRLSLVIVSQHVVPDEGLVKTSSTAA